MQDFPLKLPAGVRIGYVIALVLAVFVAAGYLAYDRGEGVLLRVASAVEAATARERGDIPDVPSGFFYDMGPPPREIPRIGEGEARSVDRGRLRLLLHAGQYERLEGMLEQLRAEHESGGSWRTETSLIDAYYSFEDLSSLTRAHLDRWVELRGTQSYVPHLARAFHRHMLAAYLRGRAVASRTSDARMRAMLRMSAGTLSDVEAARALLRRPYVPLEMIAMQNALYRGDRDAGRVAFERGVQVCRSCRLLYVSRIHALFPRWGGSHEEMQAVANAAQAYVGENPSLRTLLGMVDEDECEIQADNRVAEAVCTRALSFGPTANLLMLRARSRFQQNKQAEAVADLDAGLALAPQHEELLSRRLRVALADRQPELALRLVERLAATAPTNADLPEQALQASYQAMSRSAYYRLSGQATEAEALEQSALRLFPRIAGPRRRLLAVLASTDETFLRLLGAWRAAPDDVEARFQLGEWLREHQSPEVSLALWEEFLSRNTDHPRARFERGKLFQLMARPGLAQADFEVACRGGLREACTRGTGSAAQ